MRLKITGVLSLILCLSMLVGSLAMLSSCNKEGGKAEEKMTVVVENGATAYKIIRAEKANQDAIDIAIDLRQSIVDNLGCEIEIETDFVKAGEQPDPNALEILVGNTNRTETAKVIESLEPNSWAVVNKGKKIVICANNDGLLKAAMDWFIATYVTTGTNTLSIAENFNKSEGFGKDLPISISGVSSYQVVYPNNDEKLEYLATLVQRYTKLNGKEIKIASDNKSASDYEIVIGASRRDGVKTYSGACEYGITVDGTKVYIGASDEKTLYYAVNYFLEYGVNVQESIVTVANDYSASGSLNDYFNPRWDLYVPYVSDGTIAPAYNIGTGLANDLEAPTMLDSYMHLVSKAKKAGFESYQKKLESFGFKKTYSAQTDANELVGYTLGEARVYVHFAPKQGYLRVIWDKSSNCDVSDVETVKEFDGSTVFYQYSLDYTNAELNFTGKGINCGMLYIIKLADNSLMLVDCGHTAQAKDESLKALYDFLYSITATPVDEPLRIKFWYYTHPDGDHTELTNKWFDYIKSNRLNMPVVENLGFNFPSARANANFSKTPGSYEMIRNMSNLYPEINYLKLHTGMVFNIDEVKVEVLGTVENIVNTQGKIDASYDTNDTCSLLRFSFGGKSFLMTGDIGNHTSVQKCITDLYSKEFLKSDVLQVSHHGYNKIYDIYDRCDADFALISNAYKNARNEVYVYLYKNMTMNNIFFAGDYTYSMQVVDGEFKIYRLYRYDNPELRK